MGFVEYSMLKKGCEKYNAVKALRRYQDMSGMTEEEILAGSINVLI
jgi:hypothetical protein